MKKPVDTILNVMPFLLVALLLSMAIIQFINVQHATDQARDECYTAIGRDACER